jgi:hypothetical protein
MTNRLALVMVVGAIFSACGGGSDKPVDPAAAAAAFCADLGACNKQAGEASCASGLCFDGRDVVGDCVAVASRFRPELMPAIDACLATCGNDIEFCLIAVEAENDDRAIDATFTKACNDAFSCGEIPAPDALCNLTGLWTEATLRQAMLCVSGDCDKLERCISTALACQSSAQSDYCL